MSGPECCSNPPSLNPSRGCGHVDKVGGVDSYFSGSSHSKLALLMLSDVFGYEAPNLSLLTKLQLLGIMWLFLTSWMVNGAGHVEKLAALDSYLSGSPNSIAILLVSDVFGYEAPNLRNIADKVAAAGYYVVVPDFFYGDPYNPENASRPLSVWLKDHGTDKGSEAAKSIIEALKSKGVTAIGAAGFCWGGKVVVELAKSRLIQADVLLHPAFVSVDDIKG
ncbi:endo-1,3;1,4-beta-D-glucanase isoform X5 [Glycine max]|uniref:endo-1,3;1,4-beta-D-glucanase isoform X5 n=2 Tax=Glycine subgen. Soja TaxID=1462606 RepID=UPI001B356429|nr:endo-1,3;1,4-beta-D-glucanase isoform X5 [Glycine max]